MKVRDLLLFLFGHRASIERIASSRWAWLIGLILVATAGIARNYDHLYLLEQREWFFGPLVMSLVSTILIYACLGIGLGLSRSGKPLGPQFRSFLTMFWLTAPCAWVYAIPVENYTDILTSTKWNLAFLGIVSVWRVFIMSRAVAVLTGARATRVLVLILWPASFEMILGSVTKRFSLIQIMSGVRLPPHHIWLQQATEFTLFGSMALFFILCFMAIATGGGSEEIQEPDGQPRPSFTIGSLSRPIQKSSLWLWPVSLAILGLWGVIAMKTQPIVARNFQLEKLIKAEEWKSAVAYAVQFKETDFSKIHYLPPGPYPRQGLQALPPSGNLLLAMDGTEPSWLKQIWLEQTQSQIRLNLEGMFTEPDKLTELIAKFPALRRTIDEQAKELRAEIGHGQSRQDHEWLQKYDLLQEHLQELPE